jgi:hypothetical protein
MTPSGIITVHFQPPFWLPLVFFLLGLLAAFWAPFWWWVPVAWGGYLAETVLVAWLYWRLACSASERTDMTVKWGPFVRSWHFDRGEN